MELDTFKNLIKYEKSVVRANIFIVVFNFRM